MANKDFKRGVEAGARPFEEKFLNQEQAINRVGDRLSNELKNVSDVMDDIIDDLEHHDNVLSSIQKKSLYDLNTEFDIAETLNNDEKHLLIALLITISSEKSNEKQQNFIRSIIKYLDIYNPQASIDLAVIENIENLNSQKSIVQSIMEYLFLQYGNHQYIEDYQELFSYFSVNQRNILKIQDNINNIYNATGFEGIAEKYGYVAIEEEIEDELENKIEEKIIEYDDLFISDFLHVQAEEELNIEYKKVYIDSIINCEGMLNFNNCQIFINKKDSLCKINLGDESALNFNDCTIKYYNIKDTPFIKIEEKSRISFVNSEIIDCGNFIEVRVQSNLILEHCKIINPRQKFIKSNDDDSIVKIGNCSFLIQSQYGESETYYRNSIIESYSGNFQVYDCVFEKDFDMDKNISKIEEADLKILQVYSKLELYNCTFININNAIDIKNSYDDTDNCSIKYCTFEHCNNVIKVSGGVVIEYCDFSNTYGYICEGQSDEHSNISIQYCNFDKNIYSDGKSSGIFGMAEYHSIIKLKSWKSRCNFIENCKFTNIVLGEGFLIEGDILYKKDLAIRVDNCIFENCYTNRDDGEIIKEYKKIYGKFNRSSMVRAVSIDNCKGLDKVVKTKEKYYSFEKSGDNLKTPEVNFVLVGGVASVDFVASVVKKN